MYVADFMSMFDDRILRETNESKILVNLAVSLIALYLVTMLSYGEDMPEGACRLWAFLMAYFFMVALAWSFVEALLLVLRLKISSFGEGFLTKNYVWIAIPFSWGRYICCFTHNIMGTVL